MMRCKLDDLTNQIKEKLKDAYSVVRDRQDKITNRLKEIKQTTDQIEFNLKQEQQSNDDFIQKLKEQREQIDQIYEDLKLICDCAPNQQQGITVTAASNVSNTNSISNCSNCSLFIDNNLYPQFNYFIDMAKLIKDINDLNVQISTSNNRLVSTENEPLNDFICDYITNREYFCKVTSRLNNDGSFWIKVLCSQTDLVYENERQFQKCLEKTNLFIEELNKYVRRKRIGDKQWQTYLECKREPLQGM